MTTDKGGRSPRPSQSAEWPPAQIGVSIAVGIGLILAVVGVVAGLNLANRHRVTGCPSDDPQEGTVGYHCFTHPHSLDGNMIVVFSLMLAILIGLTGVIASVLLRRTPDTSV